MKKIIHRILFPNNILGFSFFNVGFGLLIYVFVKHLEDKPIAYVSYLLSTYALVIFVIWFCQVCKFSKDFIHKTKLYNWWQNHFLSATKSTMIISLLFNLIYGLLKLCIGIYYHSWWFITFAFYYLLLCFMKLSLVKNINNQDKEYPKLKHTGIILLVLNFFLGGIVILITNQDKTLSYNGHLIYFIALYDFYLMIKAIINVIRYRQKHGPIIAASKCLNLTVAMISMISLEVAMISQFGNNDTDFKFIMTSIMGIVITIINSGMAIYMIVKANFHLKK